jgi:hypothetical protein
LKTFLLTVAALICFVAVHAQVVYTATQSSTRKLNAQGAVVSKTPFRKLSKNATISLFNNYLVINFNRFVAENESYKFARKVDVTTDDGGYTQWNATDKNGKECEVLLKDYGTYSRIAIRYMANRYLIVYQTL